MLAGFGAANQFAPFDHSDLGLDADFGQVGLQQLRAEVRVRVQQAASGTCPDGGLEAVLEPGAIQQGLGLGEVLWITRQVLGVAPGVGRIRAVGGFGGAFKYGFEVAGLIEGQIDRLTYFGFIQGRVLAVDRHECSHECSGLFHLEGWVFLCLAYIQGLGRQGDLALIAVQLLQAHVGIRRDGEDQVIHSRFAAEVVRVGFVTNHSVFLETAENERAGTNRLAVEFLRRAGLEQLVGVFGRVNRGEAHAQGCEEGGVGMIQSEAHRQRVEGIDLLDQCWQLQRLGVREAALGDLVPRVGRVEHAFKAEAHVFGGQASAWGEILGAVELHIRVQLEGVGQAVRRHFPAVRQTWHQLAAGGIEVHQAVHQYVGGGVGGGQRVVLHHIKPFRAGLGAHAQVGGGRGQRRDKERGKQQR